MTQPLSIIAQENTRKRLTTACSKCGLVVNYIIMHVNIDESMITGFDVYHHNTDLSFDVLLELSKAFNTRDINLSCETGCSSERTHEPYIEVKKISPETLKTL